MVQVTNIHFKKDPNHDDFLYHFGFGRSTMDIKAVFGDTKFVCTGGSPGRFHHYASKFSELTGLPMSENYSKTDRFVLYKTGPVCWINHGMGTPSLSIMLVETLKLFHYAGADVTFIRIGTSGGVGVEPGSVVVTNEAINAELKNTHVQYLAGKKVERETRLDENLRNDLLATAASLQIPVVTGATICTDDFYEGQMRLDGIFCDYDEDEKMEFLKKIHAMGVRNFEMESTCFASFAARANIKAAIVCVALLNRMEGDQVKIDKSLYVDYEERPFRLVAAYIRNSLHI